MKHSFDWRDVSVRRTQAMRELDAYSWAPRPMINWPSLRGMFVTLVIVVALFGLFVVGPR